MNYNEYEYVCIEIPQSIKGYERELNRLGKLGFEYMESLPTCTILGRIKSDGIIEENKNIEPDGEHVCGDCYNFIESKSMCKEFGFIVHQQQPVAECDKFVPN